MQENVSISSMIRARMQSMREQAHLVEVSLPDPCPEVVEAICENGGKVVGTRWEAWCHSETCNHVSHDPGQHSMRVLCPASWVEEAREASSMEWAFDDGFASPVLVLPSLRLVVETGGDHYALRTAIVSLRPEAREAIL